MRQFKRTFSLLLALLMAVTGCLSGLTPAVGAEETTYEIWIQGTQVTEVNREDILGNGTMSYDAATNTLLLDGVGTLSYAGEDSGAAVIEASGDLTVCLRGSNNTLSMADYGIHTAGKLHLTGDGRLYCYAKNSGICSEGGLYMTDGQSAPKVYLYGDYYGLYAEQIHLRQGELHAWSYGYHTGSTGRPANVAVCAYDGVLELGTNQSIHARNNVVLEANGAQNAWAVYAYSGVVLSDYMQVTEPAAWALSDDGRTINSGDDAAATVRISPKPGRHLILDAGWSGGALTSDEPEGLAYPGQRITVTPIPDEGMYLNNLFVNVIVEDGADEILLPFTVENGGYSFTMPDADVQVTADFSDEPYYDVRMPEQFAHGRVSTMFLRNPEGELIELTAEPEEGYVLSTLTVQTAGGQSVPLEGTGDTRSFTMPAEDVTVSAVFAPMRYTVQIQSSDNGSVSAGSSSYTAGETVRLLVSPTAGYHLESLSVVDAGGNALALTELRQFTMPASDVTVTATFTEGYPLVIGGTRVTSANASDVFGDGKVSFNYSSKTLTLNNLVGLAQTSSNGALIDADGIDLKITGTATLAQTGSAEADYAIYAPSSWVDIQGADTVIHTNTRLGGIVAARVYFQSGETHIFVSQENAIGVKVTTLAQGILAFGNDIRTVELISKQSYPAEFDNLVMNNNIIYEPSSWGIVRQGRRYFSDGSFNVDNVHKVVVMPSTGTYTVQTRITNGNNGAVTVEPSGSIAPGTSVTLTYTPGPSADSWIDSLKLTYDCGTVPFEALGNGQFRFIMPAWNVYAELNEIANDGEYDVTLNTIGDGTLTSDVSSAKIYDTVTISAAPNRYSKMTGLLVTGAGDGFVVSMTEVDENTYSFQMPKGGVKVEANFEKIKYPVVFETFGYYGPTDEPFYWLEDGDDYHIVENYITMPQSKYLYVYVKTPDGYNCYYDNLFRISGGTAEIAGGFSGSERNMRLFRMNEVTDDHITISIICEPKQNTTVSYPVWIGDKQVTNRNMDDVFKNGQWRYDPDTQTLYGENPGTITFSNIVSPNNVAIKASGIDLTVVCNGDLHGSTGATVGYGIKVEGGDLTVKGNLSMTPRSYGLVADNITIAGGNLRITNSYGQRGIQCQNGGTLRISNTVERVEVYGRTGAIEAGTFTYGSDLVLRDPAEGGSIQNGVFVRNNGGTASRILLEKRSSYAVSASADSHATLSVSPNAESVTPGASVSFTVTPEAGFLATGVRAEDAFGDPVPLSESNGTYSFTMPASDVTVFVSCVQNTFRIITDPAIAHGTLTPSASSADVGATVTLTAAPDEGYALEAFHAETTDGTPIELDDNSFVMPRSDVVVSASFYPLGYTVTDAGSAHGSVQAEPSVASVGQTVTLTPVPEPGYALASIYAITEDGVKLALTENPRAFTMPAANVLIHALFVPEGQQNAAYELWLGATQVTAANALDIYGDGQASYDPETQTLTLNSFSGAVGTHDVGDRHYSIYAGLDLTIVGSGNLANLVQGTNRTLYGIGAPNNTVTLNGDFNLVASISEAAIVKGLTIAGGTIFLRRDSLTGALDIGSDGLTIQNGTERFEVQHNQKHENTRPLIQFSGGTATVGDDLQVTTPEGGFLTDRVYNADGSAYTGDTLVIERRPDFAVRTSGIEHGSVTAAPARASAGQTVALTPAADEGYVFESLTVTDKNGTVIPVAEDLTFTMPAAEVFVSAVFAPIDYAVTVSPAEHGSVLVIPAGPHHAGDTVTLVPKPDLGWEVEGLSAARSDDPTATVELTKQADGSYTFVMPAADVTVTASFLYGEYSVTVEQTANGTVTASAAGAPYGETIRLTVTPDTGYDLAALTVTDSRGNPVALGQDLSFTMPAADVTVYAEFARHDYVVTVEPVEHGSVLAAATAQYGQEVVLTVEPEIGYVLQSLTFTPEGGSETAVENDRFTMPAADVVVRAVFRQIDHPITVTGDSHVTVSVPETAHYQDVVTVTVTPDPGYRVDSLTVTDAQGEIPLTDGSFTMPNNGVTIALQVSPIDYTIAVLPAENGSVTPSAAVAHVEDAITFEVNPAPGYRLDRIRVFDFSYQSYPASETGFTMPPANVLVVASFTRGYTVATDVTGQGAVTVSQSVCSGGERVTYAATPDEGWELDSLTVLDENGEPVLTGNGYFTMPASDVTIFAVFRGVDYPVTLAEVGHGALEGPSTAKAGEEVALTVTPDEGWELESLTVQDENGAGIPVSSACTFTMPASGVTVTATFRAIDYTVTVGEMQHGTVTPDKLTAHVGETVTLTAKPENGYVLSEYRVAYGDDQTVAVESNQFIMPAANVTVTATFSMEVRYVDALGSPMPPITEFTVLTANTAELGEGWWVAFGSLTIHQRLSVNGSANLILCDGATLTLPAGIRVSAADSLTIWTQSHADGCGKLIATGKSGCAAIGSDQLGVGVLVINGGEITATGGENGAGIGGGYHSTGGSITIQNGRIHAAGGTNAAGIGGGGNPTWQGNYGSLDLITITGGQITALGSGTAAGIGGGAGSGGAGGGNVNAITITGGQVAATSPNGYGIGPGRNSTNEQFDGIVNEYVTFGWTEETDFIQSSRNVSPEKLRFAEGKAFLIDGEPPVEASTDNVQEACKLIPKPDQTPERYTVTVDDGITNGAVTADKETAAAGETVTLTVTPAEGCELESLTVTDAAGAAVAVSEDYAFVMPASDVTVTAVFKSSSPAYTYFVSQSLSLEGYIGVNFYVKLNDVPPADAKVVFTWGNNRTLTMLPGELTTDSSGRYKLTVRVAAAEMNDTITATLYNGETETATKQYSVAQYARNILSASDEALLSMVKGDQTKADQLRTLCRAMLIFGAKSQLQFKYHVNDLADQGLEYTLEDVGALGATVFPENFTEATGLSYSSSTLVLESQTTYRLYFTVTDQAKLDALTVKLGGDTLTYGTKGDRIYFDVANIPAANVLKDFTLTFGDLEVTANAGEYMTRILAGSNETLQNVMKALYWYSIAAKNFFGVN